MSSPIAVTIGNFDGVHLGHAALVGAARRAVGDDGHVRALVFEPHPATVLHPNRVPPRLSSFAQRVDWLKECGADSVELLTPTRELLGQSPREFIAWLAQRHQPSFIVEGGDFHFGKRRSGSVQTLAELEPEFGYRTVIVDPVESSLCDQSLVRVSSSMVRRLVALGRVRDAANLLGRSYELVGAVRPGDRRGRDIGFPTANLQTDQHLPADGIYIGTGRIGDNSFAAAISVGTKPTFGEHPRTCEAHLLGFNGPLDHYDWILRLSFDDWMRDQGTFDRVEALIAQLHRDVQRVASTHRLRSMARRGTLASLPCVQRA